jgi:multidrug efflux pump subunit AcrA (membrane-fusion protein)
MNMPRLPYALAALASLALTLALAVHAADDKKSNAPAARPALSVNTTTPQLAVLPVRLSANGDIAAWQEASVGTEANGLRLAEVRVNVGDRVKRGQVLAVFAPDTLRADLNQVRATVAEVEAQLADAAANAQRARELATTGALSQQQINQYLTAEHTARARLDAARAAAKVQELRLRQTQVLAPDDGIISARSATVGGVLPAGQELFRLIRQGRLEWRAQVHSTELARVRPGMQVQVTTPAGSRITGKVRMVAPTVDDKTRNGLRGPPFPRRCTRRHVRQRRVRRRHAARPDTAAVGRAAARGLQLRDARGPGQQGHRDQGERGPARRRPRGDHLGARRLDTRGRFRRSLPR